MNKEQDIINTKNKIMDAAYNRFGHYGYNKTTMAEIAKDCDMSAANIYRFFAGKDEIIVTLVKKILADKQKSLKLISTDNSTTCREKIMMFFQECLEQSHQLYRQNPKIEETVDYICGKHFALIEEHDLVLIEMIASIINQGIKTGEFTPVDPSETARAFFYATVMFHTKRFLNLYSFNDLNEKCRLVIKLLIQAIQNTKGEINANP